MIFTLCQFNLGKNGTLEVLHQWNDREKELFSHYISDNELTIVLSY